MINSIMKLGQYHRQQYEISDPIEKYLRDPVGKKKGVIFSIVLKNTDQNDWQFSKIDFEDYDSIKLSKILFRSGSSRGANITPTANITAIEKTFNVKILGWFSAFIKHKANKIIFKDEFPFVETIFQTIEKDKKLILNQLRELFSEIISSEHTPLLSIKFHTQQGIQYLGDIPLFRKVIERQATEGYRFVPTFGESSFGENQVCSVCGRIRDEVLGYFSYLKFYTLDKPGFISGGFDYGDAWKNYPVCANCASLVEEGKKLLDQDLTFQFYGFRYYLIPTFYQTDAAEVLNEITSWTRNPKFHRGMEQRISNAENEVLGLISEQGDVLSLRLMFFQQKQSALRILLVIEDILPSRLAKLFQLKERLEQIELFQWEKDDEINKISFNFGILRTFYPADKFYGIQDRQFLEICGKIISGKKIDFPFLSKGIMSRIRFLFAHDEPLGIQVKSGLMLLLFINELQLFHNFRGKVKKMNEQFFQDFVIHTREEFPEKVEKFFTAFEAFFTTPAEKAIFLTGALTQFLLNIQQHEKSSTPFRARLKGLKMNGEQISQLLPQIQEKLEQYDKNYYRTQEETISKYYLQAGKPETWKLSLDEMNFIFVLGMNLSNYFKIQKQEGANDEQN